MSLADSKTRFSISVGAVEASALVSDIDLILRGLDDRRAELMDKMWPSFLKDGDTLDEAADLFIKHVLEAKQTAGHLFVNPGGIVGDSFTIRCSNRAEQPQQKNSKKKKETACMQQKLPTQPAVFMSDLTTANCVGMQLDLKASSKWKV